MKIQFYTDNPGLHNVPNGYQRRDRLPTPQQETLQSTSCEQKNQITTIQITLYTCLSSRYILSASKPSAMAAQVNGQSWRLCKGSFSAV